MAMTFEEAKKAGLLNPATAPQPPQTPDVDKFESAVRGFANAATFGLAPKISAAANAGLGKLAPDIFGNQSYDQRLKEYLAADQAASEANPMTSLAASAVPTAIQAIATGGGSLARQGAVNAAMGAANAYGNSDKSGTDLLQDTLMGGATSGALAAGPGAVWKGARNLADKVTAKSAAKEMEALLKNKPEGYMQKLEEFFGRTKKEFAQEGTTIQKEAQNFVDVMKSGEVKPSQVPALARSSAVKESITPTLREVGRTLKDTAKDAAVGAALTTGANAITGSHVDPTLAAQVGLAAGATSAGRKLIGQTGKMAAGRFSTSPLAEKTTEFFSKPAIGKANTFVSQALSKDVNELTGTGTSPFSRLSDYLSQFSGGQNSNMQDEDERRKAAMELQSSPQGRSVMNSEHPDARK